MKLKTTITCTGGACLLVAALATTLSAQRPVEGSAAEGYASVTAENIALTGVTLLDGTGEPARRGQTVVISGNRIAAVGADGTVDIPAGAEVMDLTGPATRSFRGWWGCTTTSSTRPRGGGRRS